jgi:TfoX/Sxy family transcriptional regulator of competence genes
MAYDEGLAARVDELLADRDDVVERRMFGGLAFLVGGNMAVAASGQGGLLVRCDPADLDDHLGAGAEPMVMRGRPMSGWLRVDAGLVAKPEHLRHWVGIGTACAARLPAK